MSKRLPLFSVVICCYNGADVLPDCLRALSKQSYKGRIEIVVVNDGSTDDTVKIAKSFKKVKVITNKINLGPAASRNVGIKAAKGAFIAFTDDDCRPGAGWIRELHALYADEGVVGVGGVSTAAGKDKLMYRYLAAANPLAPLELDVMQPRSFLKRLGGYVRGVVGLDKKRGAGKRGDRKRAVYSLPSANLSFRKSALEAVGGFDESFDFSGEDQDLCRRINQVFPNGLWYAPKAKVLHQYEPGLRDTLRRSKAYGRGNAHFRKKHTEVKAVVFPFPFLVVAALGFGFISPWLLLAPFVLVQILYTRWPITVLRTQKIEPFLYAYIQFLQESYGNLGFLKGIREVRKAAKIERRAKRQAAKTAKLALPKTDKTFTFNKPRIFGALAASFLIFNVLEVTQNQVQAAFGVIFLAFVPGLLGLLALHISVRKLRGFLYTVTASVGLLILVALLANSLIILFPHVFRFSTLLFVSIIDVLCAILAAVAWKRLPADVNLQFRASQLRHAALAAYLLPLPFIGVVGSAVLNHSNNNTLNMLVLGVIAAATIALLYTVKKVRPALIPLFIYVCGLTLVWMGAMRGDFVSGTDISKEFYMYSLTKSVGHWSPSLYHDAYNACLSINLLPILLNQVLKVSGDFIFRAIMPLLYALLPLVTYTLYRKRAKRTIALIAALFFVMQPVFMSWSAIPVRQMIGFVFFGGLLLAIFDRALSIWQQRALILFFGLCMVLAHYSTTYIAITLLGVAYLLQRFEFRVRRWRFRWSAGVFRPIVGAPLIVALLAFSAVWYGPVNHTANNITHMIATSFSDIRHGQFDIFSSNAHSQQTGLTDQFSLNSAPRSTEQVWQSYLQKVNNKYTGLPIHPLQSKATAQAITPYAPPGLPEKVNHHVVTGFALLGQFTSKLMRLFLVVGLGAFALFIWKRKNDDEIGFEIFSIAALAVIVLLIVVPYASVDYDLGRTSQQLLPLLALPTVLGGAWLVRWVSRGRLNELRSKQFAGLLVVVYFLFVAGFIGQLTGGGTPIGLLNNMGTQYDQYVHNGEVAATSWLRSNKDSSNIYAGYFGGNRLWLAGIDKSSFYNDILPWTIDKNAYVFEGFAETNTGRATTYYQGSFVEYPYPSQLLNARKDLLYNDGQAKIYK